MTAVDVDTTVDVDFDKAIPCLFEDCDVPATWRETNHCPSRHHADVCAAHRDDEREFQERNCRTLVCATCDRDLPHPHVTWRQL